MTATAQGEQTHEKSPDVPASLCPEQQPRLNLRDMPTRRERSAGDQHSQERCHAPARRRDRSQGIPGLSRRATPAHVYSETIIGVSSPAYN
jgi:hypothetical protein